jgi:hypothetical protein
MRRSSLGLAAILGGLVVVAIAQQARPISGPPLYDGVVVFDPYKWLSPPPGLDGGAQSAQQSFSGQDLRAGFAFGTPEEPPQIQIQAVFTSLALPRGTSSVTMSIQPMAAPAATPPNGIIAGNVYQIDVVDQNGSAIRAKRGATVTLVMRGPTSLPNATIERFSEGKWTALQTTWPGVPDTFVASTADFGEVALVAPVAWVPTGELAATAAPAAPAPSAHRSNDFVPPGKSADPGSSVARTIAIAISALVVGGAMVGLLLLRRPPGSAR